MEFDGDIRVWWDTAADRMKIKNGNVDVIELTQNEAINLYRVFTKTLSLKNKLKIRINGNKRLGKLKI